MIAYNTRTSEINEFVTVDASTHQSASFAVLIGRGRDTLAAGIFTESLKARVLVTVAVIRDFDSIGVKITGETVA